MTGVEELQSGKGHRDENFPVASFVISPRHRPAILAFYRFVRAADDVADNAQASAEEKLRLLEDLRASLLGKSDSAPQGVVLRRILSERGLAAQHAEDLIEAFRRDVTKLRYSDWNDLIGYCRYSAMPVGRFVLDVHGEDRRVWPLNDALCAALQIINHLQDCAEDYRALDRIYIPLDALEKEGIGVDALAAPCASPELKRVIAGLAARTSKLLETSRPFAESIKSPRLGLEVAIIQSFAQSLAQRLARRDPLCERVHHSKAEMALHAAGAAFGFFARRFASPRAAPELAQEP